MNDGEECLFIGVVPFSKTWLVFYAVSVATISSEELLLPDDEVGVQVDLKAMSVREIVSVEPNMDEVYAFIRHAKSMTGIDFVVRQNVLGS